MHLLKASSKKIAAERKRKKVAILGSFEMYKDSKKQERQQQQQLQIPPDLLMDHQPENMKLDADQKRKRSDELV